MRILFDTHALIWFLSDSPRLPTDVRALLLRQDTRLFFSSVSVLEIAIKHSLKPEAMPCDADAFYADAIASGIEEMPFVSRHAQGVGVLPWIHRDPFDRMRRMGSEGVACGERRDSADLPREDAGTSRPVRAECGWPA